MKTLSKLVLITFGFSLAALLVINYILPPILWRTSTRWKERVATRDIDDAKRRGVFIKELHYRIDNFADTLDFHPFIEKGFHYGKGSYEETVIMENTQYPYQLSYNVFPKKQTYIFIEKQDLQKFDSTDGTWGYLKAPRLTDTVTLEIRARHMEGGKIRVWND